MGQYLRITNFLVATIILCTLQSVYCNLESTTNAHEVPGSRLERIQRLLNTLNKIPVLTIQSPDGDIIDCVNITKQVALDHPLLKNHKIQRRPSARPNRSKDKQVIVGRPESRTLDVWETQVWHQSGTRCPKGTVPVRRTTLEDVLRAPSLDLFGQKQHPINFTSPNNDGTIPPASSVEHQYAVADYTPAGRGTKLQKLYGTEATINVWKPYVERSTEFSLSQLWITSGSYNTKDLNTIEVGWQVYQQLYGDNNPRLFVYWTRNAYNQTGCYNLLCSGFVQTSTKMAVGAAISPVSSAGGRMREMTLRVFKDQKQGNWWLEFDGDNIGYWPGKLFTSLSNYATTVQWGGEVVNEKVNGVQTATDMGSGQFAEKGYGKASYFRSLQLVDSTNNLQSVAQLGKGVYTIAPNPTCYNINTNSSSNWGYYFYYGGPGKNANCP